jgi:molecular chaperone DnaJ
VFGDSVEGPKMEARTELKIPAGTQSDTKMRLREKGFHSVKGRDDRYVILWLEVPKNISTKHKKVIEEPRHFDEELKERPFFKDFTEKVRRVFSRRSPGARHRFADAA